MISSGVRCAASPATVHELVVDVEAWRLWSPHVAAVVPDRGQVHAGWSGATRAFFAPRPTTMIVDEVHPDGGFTWHSTLGPWRLDYANLVLADDEGSRISFRARLSGPGGGVLERLIGPISALGQRRRMARLAALAELVDRRGR